MSKTIDSFFTEREFRVGDRLRYAGNEVMLVYISGQFGLLNLASGRAHEYFKKIPDKDHRHILSLSELFSLANTPSLLESVDRQSLHSDVEQRVLPLGTVIKDANGRKLLLCSIDAQPHSFLIITMDMKNGKPFSITRNPRNLSGLFRDEAVNAGLRTSWTIVE